MSYEKCNENESMMKPRKGKIQYEKQKVTSGSLIKWVKWEKGLYKMGAVRWLKSQYKRRPDMFYHWKWVQP